MERKGVAMLHFFLQARFMGIVILFLVLGILSQIMIGVLYHSILKETEHMETTENKMLKQCKIKFSNCYELNEGCINIEAYVDKFMSGFRLGGISFSDLSHISGQLLLLGVFVAGLGACIDIISGKTIGQLLPYYIVSLFGVYVFFAVSSLVDIRGRSLLIRTNLVDYLENHMTKHLLLVKKEEMQPYLLKKQKTEKENRKPSFSGEEQKELEELLREFLA